MRHLMFSVLFATSAVLGACDLQPAPHKAPPAEPTPPPVKDPTAAAAQPTPPTNPPPTPPAAPTVDAGMVVPPPDAAIVATQECTDVSAHIAETLINEAQDPQQKAAMQQEKTKIILRSSEACTRDKWKPEIRNCFLKAATTDAMQACAKDLAGP